MYNWRLEPVNITCPQAFSPTKQYWWYGLLRIPRISEGDIPQDKQALYCHSDKRFNAKVADTQSKAPYIGGYGLGHRSDGDKFALYDELLIMTTIS